MNSNSPDPFHGLNPSDLMAAAAMPTDGDADTLPLKRADLPSLEEIAAAFPDLEILGRIGHGGMSAVFKARQPKLDRVVALKVLPKSLAATPGFAERFHREGRVLARLSHPSIVAVHDFGESGGFAFLVMEFVDGVNLRQAMRAGRFTPDQALKIIPAICDALQFAHTQGVLHRDIKPENILLDAGGRVKIADFGIAKILDEKGGDMLLTQSGAKLGTAPYMAPEQIEQPSSVDHRADIYSLGVVFYEMLTGELPLGRFAAPSELSSVGGNIDEIVFRALEKERTRRQQSVDEFKTQVEGAGPLPGPRRSYNYGEPFEYKSKRMLCGLPLLHIVHGRDPATGEIRTAHGFFAFGDKARGVFAFGGMAHGFFACGGMASGVVAVGGMAVGLISFGGLALGLLFALGGFGIGALAFGGFALGYHAYGGVVVGWHGVGGTVFAHQGYGGRVTATHVVKNLQFMPPLTNWLASLTPHLTVLSILCGVIWLPLTGVTWVVHYWARMQLSMEAGEDAPEKKAPSIFWLLPTLSAACGVFCWMVYRMFSVPGASPTLHLVPVLVTMSGLLMFVLALPLWLRLIPINPLYGLRVPSTMISDERWYDANAFAGKRLFWWSVCVIIAGLAGFYQLPRHQESYPWAVLAFTLAAVAAAGTSCWWWLRHHPVDGPVRKDSRLAKLTGQIVIAVIVAFFIRSFILHPFKIPHGAEAGVNPGSHWLASKLDTGFSPGNLIVYEHDNGQPWNARIVEVKKDGLLLKRGGSPDTFFVKWNKVIGKLIFSHFTPAIPVVGKTAERNQTEPLEGTRHWEEGRAPELKFVRFKRSGGETWPDKVYDSQGRPVKDTESLRQLKESLPNVVQTSDAKLANEHQMQLWFEHPDLDDDSMLEIALLDESGQTPWFAHGMPMPSRRYAERPPLRSCILSLGSQEKLPLHVAVQLGFSTGPWELSNKILPEFKDEVMLGGIAGYLTATGEDKEGRAFVSWHNESLLTEQVDCHAILKSGMKIARAEASWKAATPDARLAKYRSGPLKSARLESMFFQAPLSEVSAFQIRHRPIMFQDYRQIVVPPFPDDAKPGEPPAVKKTRMMDRPAVKPTSKALDQAPKLLFLRLAPNGQPWSEELYDPGGKPVTVTPEIVSILEETTHLHSSDQSDDYWLQAWIQHPDLDDASLVRGWTITAHGKPEESEFNRESSDGHAGAAEGLEETVYSVVFRIDQFGRLPSELELGFDYSIGPWTSIKRLFDTPGANVGTDIWLFGGLGENAEQNSFVTWYRRSEECQIICHALDKKGMLLRGLQSTIFTADGISEQAVFGAELKDIKAFELCVRDVRHHTFQKVRLPPKQEPVVLVFGVKQPWKPGLKLGAILDQHGAQNTSQVRVYRQFRNDHVQINSRTREIELSPGDRITLPP